MPSDPLDITLSGQSSYDLWLNLASTLSYQRGPLISGYTGGGMFPGTTMWAPYKSQFWSSATQGELIKISNGTGGGPYPAGSSMYYGGASPDSNVNGGSLAAKGYAMPGVKTVAFQLSLGEAYGYSLWDAASNGIDAADLPKLKLIGTGGATIATLDAAYSGVIKKAYNGSMEMPPGSGLDEDVYINTLGLQWNLSAIEQEIVAFEVHWTGVQHAQLWSFRLDQSDAPHGSFVFDLTSNWTGSDDGKWATSGNWQGGLVPANVGRAVFGTGSSVELDGNATIGQILINTPGDFTIGTANDSKLTTSLNLTTTANGGPAAHTIATDLGVPSVVTLDVGADTSLAISGDVSGTGIYKRGAGALSLSGAGDYSGALIFGGGTTTVSGANLTSAGSQIDIKNARLILDGNDRFEGEFKAKLSGTSVAGQAAFLQLGDADSGAVTQTLAELNALKPQYVKDLNPNPQFEPPVHVVGGNPAISTLTLKGGTYSGKLGGSGTNENQLSVVANGAVTLQGLSTYAGDTVIKSGAVLQVNRAAALSPNSNIRIEGGFLALGSFSYIIPGGFDNWGDSFTESFDLFTRPIGAGPGEVQITTGGGFKAVGGNRTLNFGGAGAELTWGQNGFVADGAPLVLASDNNSRLTLANAIDFGATPRTVHLDVSNFAELTGALRGSGGLVKTGMGHLYLSGVNQLTGPVVVNGGQLHVNAMGNGGIMGPLGNTSSAASNIVLGSGAETWSGGQLSYHSDTNSSTDRLFTLSGAAGTIASDGAGAIHFTNTGAVVFTHGGPVSFELRGVSEAANRFDPLISDNGSFPTTLRKGGNGAGGSGGYWIIGRGDNSYTGPTNIQSGTLEIPKIANGGLPSSIGASSNAAANFTMFRGGIKYTGSGDSTDRAFAISQGAAIPCRIDSSGSGALAFTNTGDVMLSDVSGVVSPIGAGGWLALGGTYPGVNTFAARIGGSTASGARFIKDGAGTWELSQTANTYTGNTEVLGGTLGITSIKNGGVAVVMTTTLNSTAAAVTNAAGLSAGQLVQGPGLQVGTTITAISGTGVTLSLPATQTIASGNNRNKVAGTPSTIGTSPVAATSLVLNGGTLKYMGSGDSSDRRFTVGVNGAGLDSSGTGTLVLGNTAAVTYAGTTARTISLGGTNAGANTLAAAIGNAGAGAVSLLKSGVGTWVLNGANSYTGSTTVTGGTLKLTIPGLADGSTVSVAAGAKLELGWTSGATDLVDTLILDGQEAAPGLWGAVGSGATHTSPLLAGSGVIIVSGPFEDYAAQITNAANRSRAADGDGDGFSNLHEYLFGTAPSGATASLVETTRSGDNLIIRWKELLAGASYQLLETTDPAANPWPLSAVLSVTAADQSGLPAGYVRKEAVVPISDAQKFLRVNGAEN